MVASADEQVRLSHLVLSDRALLTIKKKKPRFTSAQSLGPYSVEATILAPSHPAVVCTYI